MLLATLDGVPGRRRAAGGLGLLTAVLALLDASPTVVLVTALVAAVLATTTWAGSGARPVRTGGGPRTVPQQRGTTEPVPASDRAADSCPTRMSDEDIFQAWRVSYVRLRYLVRVGEPAQIAVLVAERAAYLDEMQRRDPAGYAAWMAAGPVGATNPARYLGRGFASGV